MEQDDRRILQHTLAMRVGKVVSEIIRKEQDFEEDIHIEVFVEHPSCYVDDLCETHTGRLISVVVDFVDEEEDD